MNLIEDIFERMSTDDDNLDRQSKYLAAIYIGSDNEAKTKLDEAFIALCGYSLETLVKLHGV